jgi:cytochrome c-type biogenesis protein
MAGGGAVLAPPPPSGGATDRAVALRAGLSFVGGFTAVFMALGVLVNAAGAALNDNRVWLTRIGGVFLVVMGLHLLGVFRLRAAEKESRFLSFTGRKGYVGAFLVGIAFAAGWSPCIGPVLSGILTMAASGGSTLQAAVLLLAYSAGLAIPFLLAAMALDRFLNWSSRLRRSWLPVAERVSGALVLVVGVLLLTGIFSDMAGYLAN